MSSSTNFLGENGFPKLNDDKKNQNDILVPTVAWNFLRNHFGCDLYYASTYALISPEWMKTIAKLSIIFVKQDETSFFSLLWGIQFKSRVHRISFLSFYLPTPFKLFNKKLNM